MNQNIKTTFYKLYSSSWFITLFATTLGVLLALYLDNLNSNLKIEDRKQTSIVNINKELLNNQSALLDSNNNDSLIDFLSEIRKINSNFSNELDLSMSSMNRLKREYSGFFEIKDSLTIDDDLYNYDVNYKFLLDLDNLQNIAWETSKMSNITTELDYDCLQNLVEIYSLQEIYANEQQKILDYFINANHIKLLSAMLIVQQLKSQLLEIINEGLQEIESCD